MIKKPAPALLIEYLKKGVGWHGGGCPEVQLYSNRGWDMIITIFIFYFQRCSFAWIPWTITFTLEKWYPTS